MRLGFSSFIIAIIFGWSFAHADSLATTQQKLDCIRPTISKILQAGDFHLKDYSIDLVTSQHILNLFKFPLDVGVALSGKSSKFLETEYVMFIATKGTDRFMGWGYVYSIFLPNNMGEGQTKVVNPDDNQSCFVRNPYTNTNVSVSLYYMVKSLTVDDLHISPIE